MLCLKVTPARKNKPTPLQQNDYLLLFASVLNNKTRVALSVSPTQLIGKQLQNKLRLIKEMNIFNL